MRAAVIQFPGSNCDRDLKVSFDAVSGNDSTQMVWHKEASLPDGLDIIGIPGGFSFGDYLRCGAIAARSPIMSAVKNFADEGGYVIGICNGFQVLTETGILPGVLMQNADIKFLCKTIELQVETTNSPYTDRYTKHQKIQIPIAHHEGNYRADEQTLAELKDQDRIAFTYTDNPNGAAQDIAGILSKNRRVLGMMPHPERMADPKLGGTDGKALFAALAESIVSA
ncbi:MAG: phosphoribosylformylglycinamidine synthase subunit PurQ [Pseudomonadota bacterium]